MILKPIAANIQNTLYQKIAMLEAGQGGSIGRDGYGDWTSKNIDSTMPQAGSQNYMFTRSPYMKMTSFTTGTNYLGEPIILMGGELDRFGNIKGDFVGGKYSSTDYRRDLPVRPLPGIKDVSVEYKGGGMKLGAIRTADINWTCWSWEELERLTPHFLAPRRTVLIEWGWSGFGDLKDVETFVYTKPFEVLDPAGGEDADGRPNVVNTDARTFDKSKIVNMNQRLLAHIQIQNGHYDAMLGLVTSFDWTINDEGGFDCTTTIISQGISLLQSTQKGDDVSKFENLPLVGRVKGKDGQFLSWNERSGNAAGQSTGWDETLRERSAYITFREYMSDFRSQVEYSYMKPSTESQTGRLQPIVRIGLTKPKGMRELNPKLIEPKYNKGVMNIGKKKGDNYFVSWGWFEDNVLSRFFGKISDSSGIKRVLCEFRSGKQSVDDKGLFKVVKKNDIWGPLYEENQFVNSKYLITVDSSKWLIPKEDDDIYKFFTIAKLQIAKSYASDSPKLPIRSILFNAGYLSDKMKGTTDITQAIMNVWDDFSRTYGGVYKFKIEFDDNNSRLCLVEESHTDVSVISLLERRVHYELTGVPHYPRLFVFPVMEKGSIVKTQTLNAKLPDRMQVAAMYGVKEQSITDKENTTYEDLIGLSWGQLSSTKKSDNTTKKSDSERKKERYDDLMTGDIDFPSRMNRAFGQTTGNIEEPLHIGSAGRDGYDDKKGTRIKTSILDDIGNSQKAYLSRRSKDDSSSGVEIEGEEPNAKAFQDLIDNFNDPEKNKSEIRKNLAWYEVLTYEIPIGSRRPDYKPGTENDPTEEPGWTGDENIDKPTEDLFGDADKETEARCNTAGDKTRADIEAAVNEASAIRKKIENQFIANLTGKAFQGVEPKPSPPGAVEEGPGASGTAEVGGLRGTFLAGNWFGKDDKLSDDAINALQDLGYINVEDVKTLTKFVNSDASEAGELMQDHILTSRDEEERKKKEMDILIGELEERFGFPIEYQHHDFGGSGINYKNPVTGFFETSEMFKEYFDREKVSTNNVLGLNFIEYPINDFQFTPIPAVTAVNTREIVSNDEMLQAETEEVEKWDAASGIEFACQIKLKPELMHELQKKLRGSDGEDGGIISMTNPLIPVDFEMEIDGTGGLFPGNSFHSSYFSNRYKKESVFQMVGVGHTIDSSGWSTTIKGQIRARALADYSSPIYTKNQEKSTDGKKLTLEDIVIPKGSPWDWTNKSLVPSYEQLALMTEELEGAEASTPQKQFIDVPNPVERKPVECEKGFIPNDAGECVPDPAIALAEEAAAAAALSEAKAEELKLEKEALDEFYKLLYEGIEAKKFANEVWPGQIKEQYLNGKIGELLPDFQGPKSSTTKFYNYYKKTFNNYYEAKGEGTRIQGGVIVG